MKNGQYGTSGLFKRKLGALFDPSVLTLNDNGKRITILSILIPKLFEVLYAKLISSFNTKLISGYAEDAVGAITSATQIINIFNTLLAITTLGATILVSIEIGSGNRERAGTVSATSLFMLLFSSFICCSFMFLAADPLLKMLNLSGESLSYGTSYLKIAGGLLFINATAGFINTMLICNGKAFHSMISAIIANTLNLIFVFLLLKVKIIPSVTGASAIATAGEAACFISLVYSLIIFIKTKCPFIPAFDKSQIKRIYTIGIPGSVAGLSYLFAQTITVGFIGGISIVSLNAYSYINGIIAYTCIGSAIISAAVPVFIGRFIGRGDIESVKKFCRITLLFAVGSNGTLSIIAFIFRNELLSIFTSSEEILAMALVIFAIDFIIECFRGVVNVLESALNSCKDVFTTLGAGIASSWLCIVMLSYVLGTLLGLGLYGCWIAFALSEIMKATIYIVRFKRGGWISHTRI